MRRNRRLHLEYSEPSGGVSFVLVERDSADATKAVLQHQQSHQSQPRLRITKHYNNSVTYAVLHPLPFLLRPTNSRFTRDVDLLSEEKIFEIPRSGASVAQVFEIAGRMNLTVWNSECMTKDSQRLQCKIDIMNGFKWHDSCQRSERTVFLYLHHIPNW